LKPNIVSIVVEPHCIMPCLKGLMNWSNSHSFDSVLYVTLLLPWNYAKQIYIALLCAHLYEFMKVVKLIMVQIMGSIEDERTFLTLTFMKTRLWDQFNDHLDLMVHMFAIALLHCFNFFLYNDPITTWTNEKARKSFLAWIVKNIMAFLVLVLELFLKF
jgi:hypothetical protein